VEVVVEGDSVVEGEDPAVVDAADK